MAAFLDSNVLIYLASADAAKAARAEGLVATGGMISVQVLNEIANVGRRRMGLSWPELHGFLDAIRGLVDVVPMTVETHETGLTLAERYRFAPYDAMIAAAALLAGCDTLWSEDMHNGTLIEGRVRITNPFA